MEGAPCTVEVSRRSRSRKCRALTCTAAVVLAATLQCSSGSTNPGVYTGPGQPVQRPGQSPNGYPQQQPYGYRGPGSPPGTVQGQGNPQGQGPMLGQPTAQGEQGQGQMRGQQGQVPVHQGQVPGQQGQMQGQGPGAPGAYRGQTSQGYPPQQGGYGGYPGSQGGYGRTQYQQQGPVSQIEGPGLFSRLTSRLKGEGGAQQGFAGQSQTGAPQQGYGGSYGRYPAGGPQQFGQQGQQQGWQQQGQPGMALQPAGQPRGPMVAGYQGQDQGYANGSPQQQGQGQGQGQVAHGQGMEGGWLSRIKEKVFQGDTQEGQDKGGAPSFRPHGSSLKVEDERAGMGSAQGFAAAGAFGNPYPTFGGPGMGIVGGGGVATVELSGPGTPEVISVDNSVVLILKPNELIKKKRKFKQDGTGKLQVITTFDHCLTGFLSKDGKTNCLKTTDLLEQNPHVMLPEAAKKVRYLRTDFKRRMEAEGKNMSPEERVSALEDNLRKVYSVVAMEGGVHMNSIGPAIESQLESIPLRDGVDDLTAALAWRAIPLTVFCAGYGNVAMEVLRKGAPRIVGPGGVFTPHLRLVANFFRPDDTMTIIGMFDTVPLVHEAKKTGTTLMEFLRGARLDPTFASRSNVVLLGSELSDLGLTNGLPSLEGRITVGFLKLDEHMLEKLPRYAQAYDVVVVGDGDMSYANEILHEITG